MSTPSPQTVLGDFGDVTVENCRTKTRFFTENGRYFVETQGPSGDTETFPVQYTFGHDPLQQYLLPTSKGRLQAFTIAWDAVGETWLPLYPDDCFEPGEWLHWTGDGMNWNYMCAECHSTNLRRNFDLSANAYETSYSEVDVSCEACHGPGERHVELVRTDSYGKGGTFRKRTGLTVDLSTGATSIEDLARRSDGHAQVETCAPCHSRRRVVFPNHIAGKPFLDHYEPELLDEGLYFADGQIRDEVYVYGSFIQSKMYANGVRCGDCHDPHSTELKLQGNALCGQCHEPAQYDTFEHLRHGDGTRGSNCVDCHMPERTYMVVDPRRDHGFAIPRPDLTTTLGTPNACSNCHDDRSAEWAAEKIRVWHGDDRPASFAPAIAGGRRRLSEAEPALIELVRDRAQPAIVRATALSLLGSYPTVRAREAAEDVLDDPSGLVRSSAVRSLSGSENREIVPRLEGLLSDSVRLVRIETARVLTQLAPGRYAADADSEIARAYWKALDEYRTGQLALNDQAASHLNLALIHESLGEMTAAEDAYETALRLDSSFVPAHMNIALLYDRMRGAGLEEGRADEAAAFYDRAVDALERAVRLQPDAAQAHYSLGLLLAENRDRLAESAEHLLLAAEIDTANARMQYNAGLAHQRLERPGVAEPLLLRAHQLAPDHPDYINALSIFYAQQEQWREAARYTEMLLAQYPTDGEIVERRAYIRSQLEN